MAVITISGFVVEQPEVRYSGENPVIKFKVADKQRRKIANQWESVNEYFTFEQWGVDAVKLAEKLTKGRNVEVVGHKPKTEKWTGNDGAERQNMVWTLLSATTIYQEPQERDGRVDNAPQSQPRPARYASPGGSQALGAEKQGANQHFDAEPRPNPRGNTPPEQGALRNHERPQAPIPSEPKSSAPAQGSRFSRGANHAGTIPRTEY